MALAVATFFCQSSCKSMVKVIGGVVLLCFDQECSFGGNHDIYGYIAMKKCHKPFGQGFQNLCKAHVDTVYLFLWGFPKFLVLLLPGSLQTIHPTYMSFPNWNLTHGSSE